MERERSRKWNEAASGKFSLNIRKRFFTETVAGHWNRLPTHVVTAPMVSEFKQNLDDALSHMV